MHVRRYILESIRTQLKTVAGFGGVWIQRIPPQRTAYPCITLYAEADAVDTVTIHTHPRQQDRLMTVSINAWIRGTPDSEKAEADLDAAALAVEQGMTGELNATDYRLISTEFNVDEDDPELHHANLIYQFDYSATEANPVA